MAKWPAELEPETLYIPDLRRIRQRNIQDVFNIPDWEKMLKSGVTSQQLLLASREMFAREPGYAISRKPATSRSPRILIGRLRKEEFSDESLLTDATRRSHVFYAAFWEAAREAAAQMVTFDETMRSQSIRCKFEDPKDPRRVKFDFSRKEGFQLHAPLFAHEVDNILWKNYCVLMHSRCCAVMFQKTSFDQLRHAHGYKPSGLYRNETRSHFWDEIPYVGSFSTFGDKDVVEPTASSHRDEVFFVYQPKEVFMKVDHEDTSLHPAPIVPYPMGLELRQSRRDPKSLQPWQRRMLETHTFFQPEQYKDDKRFERRRLGLENLVCEDFEDLERSHLLLARLKSTYEHLPGFNATRLYDPVSQTYPSMRKLAESVRYPPVVSVAETIYEFYFFWHLSGCIRELLKFDLMQRKADCMFRVFTVDRPSGFTLQEIGDLFPRCCKRDKDLEKRLYSVCLYSWEHKNMLLFAYCQYRACKAAASLFETAPTDGVQSLSDIRWDYPPYVVPRQSLRYKHPFGYNLEKGPDIATRFKWDVENEYIPTENASIYRKVTKRMVERTELPLLELIKTLGTPHGIKPRTDVAKMLNKGAAEGIAKRSLNVSRYGHATVGEAGGGNSRRVEELGKRKRGHEVTNKSARYTSMKPKD